MQKSLVHVDTNIAPSKHPAYWNQMKTLFHQHLSPSPLACLILTQIHQKDTRNLC